MRRHILGAWGLVLAGLGALLAGCAQEEVPARPGQAVGSGHLVQQEIPLTGFSGVHVGFGMSADITVGESERVQVQGDDNLLALLTWKVKDGVLSADRDPQWDSFRPSQPLHLTVVTPHLTRLRASGGAHANASGVEVPGFALDASAGSEVALVGHAGQVVLEASGGSWVDLRRFPSEGLDVAASGGSRVHATVSGQVTGQLSGGSVLTCDGQPSSRLVSTSGGAGVSYP